MTNPESSQNFSNLHQILTLLQEINRGNKEKVNELSVLMRREDTPEIVHELCEAIMLTLVKADASEFRWRSKIDSLAPVKGRGAAPQKGRKILIWEQEGELKIDLSHAIFIPKLSEFTKALSKEIHAQVAEASHDLIVDLAVDAEQLPEMIDLGIRKVFVYARSEMAHKLQGSLDHLTLSLNVIFHSLQLPYWGGTQFVAHLKEGERLSSFEEERMIPNLLFPFHLFSKPGKATYFCFVEHEAEEGLLRITIDDPGYPVLNLENIPHVVVKDLDRRVHIRDLRYVAKTVYYEILRAKENSARQLAYHFGTQRDYGIFQELQDAGLMFLNTIMIYWSQKTEKHFTVDPADISISQIGRILLALEEKALIEQLMQGKRLEVVFELDRSAYLDLSMRGQWLNISLEDRRSVASTFYYLNRMPHMRALAANKIKELANLDVFLIHHLTPEVLALIKGLDHQACESAQVLFVKYNPNVPSNYREAVLTMPEDRFHFATLQKCSEGDFSSDYFTLSDQFSSLKGWRHLKESLEEKKLDFGGAMCLVAGHMFFVRAFQAQARGIKLLIIEDGGYLAPFLNQLCLEKKSLRESLQYYCFSQQQIQEFESSADLSLPLDQWLKLLLIGSIEHTRNGYDALMRVYEKFQQLAFPACTIAISKLKRFKEGDEVAISILHAVESMLHILGFVISQRNVLVLGSKGTIGAPLRRHLLERISGHVLGVDLQIASGNSLEKDSGFGEVHSLEELPDEVLGECDLFIGVIGQSILNKEGLERLFRHSRSDQLFFASGSTKKVEFSHLTQFLHELQQAKNPMINNIPVVIEETEVRDPGSYAYLGKCIRVSAAAQFADKIPNSSHPSSYFLSPPPEGYVLWKELFLLGDLMPINFFYSGVPTEIIDLVLTQLMQIALGLAKHDRAGDKLPQKVLAVDVDINDESDLIN